MRNPVGGHVPVAGGLAKVGLGYARELGAETVQVFVANPRGWATPPGNPAEDERFRAECAAESISAWVHAPYLINFGSHTEATAEKSVESMRHSLRRGREIGAKGVVVHTGSATGGRPRAEALAQVRELLLPLLDELTHDDDPDLLLESTALPGLLALLARGGLRPVLRRAGPASEAGDLPRHLPHLRRRPRPDRSGRRGADARPAGGDRGRGTVEADPRQRLPGRRRRPQGPAREHRRGPHRRGRVPQPPPSPGDRGRALIIETPGGTAGHLADVELLKKLRP